MSTDSFWTSAIVLADSIYRTGLIYSLVFVNLATSLWEAGYTFTHKSIVAAINAHKRREFVFLERNACPWQRYREEEELGVMRIQYPLIYDVDTNHFTTSLVTSQEKVRLFSDVVTVELVNSDETVCFDLSSFFHSLTSCDSAAPSVFEVVLTYCLEDGLVFTTEKLRGFRVKVFTVEGEEISILLKDATTPFTSWADYNTDEQAVSPAPSATSAVEDDSPAQLSQSSEESNEQEEHPQA